MRSEFNVHFLLGRLYGHLGDRAAMVTRMAFAQDLDPRNSQRSVAVVCDRTSVVRPRCGWLRELQWRIELTQSRIREALEAVPDDPQEASMQT